MKKFILTMLFLFVITLAFSWEPSNIVPEWVVDKLSQGKIVSIDEYVIDNEIQHLFTKEILNNPSTTGWFIWRYSIIEANCIELIYRIYFKSEDKVYHIRAVVKR
jgi:hypothetical protein